jgi:hypothetical protein
MNEGSRVRPRFLLVEKVRRLAAARACEEVADLAIAEVGLEFLGELGKDRDVSFLATLTLAEVEHRLLEVEVADLDGDELGDPRSQEEQGLHEQAALPARAVGLRDEPGRLVLRKPVDHVASFGRALELEPVADVLRDLDGLVVGEVVSPPEPLGVLDDPAQRQFRFPVCRSKFEPFRHAVE